MNTSNKRMHIVTLVTGVSHMESTRNHTRYTQDAQHGPQLQGFLGTPSTREMTVFSLLLRLFEKILLFLKVS